MDLPRDILERSPEEAACEIALGYLSLAERGARRLARAAGDEDLHDFRVGVRRLRSALRAWKHELRGRLKKKHRRALRDVQIATGSGRDFEVAAEWISGHLEGASLEEREGEAWVAARFEARYQAAMADLRDGALKPFKAIARTLRKRLRAGDRPAPDGDAGRFAGTLARALREHIDDVVAHLARIESVADVEEAHEARIRVKRLRYLIEPFDGVLPEATELGTECKRLQDVLGDMNDARVLRGHLAHTEVPAGGEGERVRAGLDSLRRGVTDRQTALFDALERGWLADRVAVLRAGVGRMILACLPAGERGTEIERKYLLRALPEVMPGARSVVIDQGWLPGVPPRERLRCKAAEGTDSIYFRTVKIGRGLERVEMEDAISPEIFHALWPLTRGSRVHKRRYIVSVGDRAWEIDAFLDRDGAYFAEIELDSVDEAVEIPDWLAPAIVREVTDEAGFTNLELAQ